MNKEKGGKRNEKKLYFLFLNIKKFNYQNLNFLLIGSLSYLRLHKIFILICDHFQYMLSAINQKGKQTQKRF